jgi:hypothetical protein
MVIKLYAKQICQNHLLQMDTISCIELEKEQRSVTINPTINSSIILTDGTKSPNYYKSVVNLE